MIVRVAGEGRRLLRSLAPAGLRLLECQRLLVVLCAFIRRHGELIESSDHAGDADVTVPPSLQVHSAVDAVFEGGA